MSKVFDTELPFPTLAKTALADAQLRANLKHATTTIRDKRLRVVGELDDVQRQIFDQLGFDTPTKERLEQAL